MGVLKNAMKKGPSKTVSNRVKIKNHYFLEVKKFAKKK